MIEDPSSNLFEIDDIQKSIMKDQKSKKNKRKRIKKKAALLAAASDDN